MNWKMWAPLALAVVLGLVAAMVARDLLSRKQEPTGPQIKMTQLVVVKKAVRAGSELRAEDLQLGPVAGDTTPEGTFANPADLVGRVTTAPLVPGQAVTTTLLAAPGSGRGLQATVPAGMRAVTFEINETSGVAGYLVAGCHVDVVTTLQNGEDTVARTVVENIEVTAVGSPAPPPGSDAPPPPVRSVTLLCTPKDAQAIELASSTSRPRLILRGSLDDSPTSQNGVTLAELRGKAPGDGSRVDPFGTYPAESVQPSTKPSTLQIQNTTPSPASRSTYERVVKVIRGGSESNVVFEVPSKKGSGLMTDVPTGEAVGR